MEFLNNIFTSQEENTTPSLEFSIPESVFSRLSLETQAQRLELWVEMLDIQT